MRRKFTVPIITSVLILSLALLPSNVLADFQITDIDESGYLPVQINDAGQVAFTRIYVVEDEFGNLIGRAHAFLWKDGVFTKIGTPGSEDNSSVPFAINEVGQVAGESTFDPHFPAYRAFFWDPVNGIQDLGTLGGIDSHPTDINNSGQVVGTSRNAAGQQRAFVWDSVNGMQNMGTLGGSESSATAINNLGQVVGYSVTVTGGIHAFLWDSVNGMQDLTPDLAPLVYSRAVDINDAGQVLIISEDADLGATSSSLIWEDGVLTDLGNLGGDFTNGVDINERGHVVGSFEIPIGRFVFHAFFWDPDGGMQDLGTLGGVTSDALKINELDQVIGNSLNVAGQERAFIWDSANGMQDLGTLGGAFSRASDINESGQIVGISLESGPLHAVIWQPPPPPEPVFCQDMTINELILSDLYNVIDNRDGHLGDKVKGTKGNDLILASDSGNKINAKRGDDCVIGGGGNDKINGGKGDDQIFGQGGSDKINGNKGNDNIQGGDDDDKIHGGHGDDIIKGDGGNDTCHGGHGSNQVDCETVKPMEDEDEDDE